MEPAGSVYDPSKGVGDRRSGLGRPTSAPARLPSHMGNRRWRSEGQLVHGYHMCHIVPVAGHGLSHTGQ